MNVGGKKIVGALGLVVALGAAITAYDEIRPFPTIAEHEQVAGRSCKNELSFLKQELRDVDRRISDARAQDNTDWLQTLQEQRSDILETIKMVKHDCGWE